MSRQRSDYDTELEVHASNIASNDRFVLAMARAVKENREHVKLGTFVDHTAPSTARQ